MPGFIMLITRIITGNAVHGPAFVMSLLMVILWQFIGSVGITVRNLWRFYLANIVGMVLFLMVFTYEQIFMMSLPNFLEEYSWLLLGFPLFGLIIGFFREGYKTMASDDSQRVNQHEQSKPAEKE